MIIKNRRCSLSSLLTLLVLLLTSCVHEFPTIDEEAKTDVTLLVSLNSQEMGLFQTIGYNRSLTDRNVLRRYIVEVYRKTKNRSSYDTAPVYQTTVYQQASESEPLTVPLSLCPDEYRIAVWMDYVDAPGSLNPFYQTDFLNTIHLPPPESYVGDTDMKDCCSGLVEVDIASRLAQGEKIIEIPCVVERPLAKFMFIATDVDSYITRVMSRSGRVVTRSDIDKYTARIVYTGYLPNGFNVLTNKPNDSAMGYSCTTGVRNIENNEVCLGFDYVLINTHDASVEAAIIIYDEEGTEVNSSPTIRIPLHRNGLTEIRDEFFTIDNYKGITIKPEFDGEYNIYY